MYFKMKWLILLSWFLLSAILWIPSGKGVFGVCVSYQATGNVTTYMAYIQNPMGYSHRRTLSENEFIKFASGHWPSVYNPRKENLFALEQINCGVDMDVNLRLENVYCNPMSSLWKLRFRVAPMKGIQEEGWSGKEYRPSSGQEQYLYKEFGIRNIDRDFFVDTNFWKLLRSVENPEWINYYKNLP
jgi:hypothetical protein